MSSDYLGIHKFVLVYLSAAQYRIIYKVEVIELL